MLFFSTFQRFFVKLYLKVIYWMARFLRSSMKNYESFGLLAHYNKYGAKKSRIVGEILTHKAYNYQIPSSVPYEGVILKGYTVLHIALKNKDLDTFVKFLNNGADFSIKNYLGATVLHQAFESLNSKPEEESLLYQKFILGTLAAHVKFAKVQNPRDKNGISHFHIACAMNNEKAVRMFLRNGVTIDETVNVDSQIFPGFTPLHFAAKFCCVETFEILFDKGADFTVKNAHELTALHLLIERNMAIVDWKNMGKRNVWTRTRLELLENEYMIDLIMTKFDVANDDVIDDTRLTSLQVACVEQEITLIQTPLKKTIDLKQCVGVNSPLWPGYTALHFAAHFNPEIVELLLKNKANFLAKDDKGTTPLDLCMQRYEVKDLHGFMSLDPMLKDIRFTDGTTSLLDAVLAMKDERTLSDFFENVTDVNMSICRESPIWPGYTLLHLAVSLPERKEEIENIYKYSRCKLKKGDKMLYNCSKDEEAIYLSRLKMCLNRGVDFCAKDSHNSTALHLAFRLKKTSAVNLFLESDKNHINYIDNDNLSHLHVACAADNENVVKSLMSKVNEIDVNCAVTSSYDYCVTRNEKLFDFRISAGSSPLHIAISNESLKIVQLLTNSKENIYKLNGNGMTPIHQLMIPISESNDKCEKLKNIANILLNFDDNLKECQTSFGLSHLHIASYADGAGIDKLLKNGANIDAKISYLDICALVNEDLNSLIVFEGYTPLHVALKFDKTNAIKTLIRRGADILKVPSAEIAYLLKKKSDMIALELIDVLILQETIRTTFGLTMLHVACAKLDVESVENLLSKGADPNEQINVNAPLWAGNTALHFLMIKRDIYLMNQIEDIVQLLLKYEADVTIKNAYDKTCVYEAFFRRFEDPDFASTQVLHKLLLAQRDFSVNPVSKEGLSHLHIAVYLGRTSIVKKFVKCGIDVNQPIDYLFNINPGSYPIHISSYYEQSDITDILLRYGAAHEVRNTAGQTPYLEAWNRTFFRTNQIPEPEAKSQYYLSIAGANKDAQTPKGETNLEFGFRSRRFGGHFFRNTKHCVNYYNRVNAEGNMAMALSLETDEHSFVNILHCRAVINAPHRNGPDQNGRSVIHNVVSIYKTDASTKLYINVIRKFMQLNFDLEHKDVRGWTALHYAMRFGNHTAISALLALGADLNAADNLGRIPLFYANQFYKREICSEVMENEHRQYFESILELFYKMKIARVYISEKDRKIVESFKRKFKLNPNAIERIDLEVERLKEKRLDRLNMTCWDLLPEKSMVSSYLSFTPRKRLLISEFMQINSNSLYEEFPEFAGLLLTQYRKAVERIDLVEPAKHYFNLLTDYALPDLCCNLILVHVNNEDLKSLIKLEPYFPQKSSFWNRFFQIFW